MIVPSIRILVEQIFLKLFLFLVKIALCLKDVVLIGFHFSTVSFNLDYGQHSVNIFKVPISSFSIKYFRLLRNSPYVKAVPMPFIGLFTTDIFCLKQTVEFANYLCVR